MTIRKDEPPLREVPWPAVPLGESIWGQARLRRAEEEVELLGHQHLTEKLPAAPADRQSQSLGQARAVALVVEDPLARVAPAHVLNRWREGTRLSMIVYASWNGSTQTAAWRLLAGPNPDALSPVSTTSRTGFETALSAATISRCYQVQALDAQGHVLRSSHILRNCHNGRMVRNSGNTSAVFSDRP